MDLKKFFSRLCHQIPSRCYFFCGEPLYVCSRCLGIYIGFLAQLFWLFLIHSSFEMGLRLFWIGLFFVPMAIDGTTQIFGVRKSNNTLRFISGFLAGMGTAYLAHSGMSVVLSGGNITSKLPTFKSLIGILFIIPFMYVLKKYQTRNKPFLKHFFNGLSVLSLLVLVGIIIYLYSIYLGSLIF